MTGSVTLVGGGPGPVELLTLAAVRALAAADVVLFDRLAPHDDLAELAPRAELIDVGKRPGHHAIGQESIQAIMVDRALAGADVVRLKGGDPFVFGRGGEEVLACRAAGVPVRVIPGVTSAVSVPASVGIPVTHRDVSRLFTVVSGHAPLSEEELRNLAGLRGTIVILMGVTNLPSITAGLVRHGLGADTPVAIIERGFARGQRTVVSTLSTVMWDAAAHGVAAPAVIVVGDVVGLAVAGDADAQAALDAASLSG
ncbi:MULTISPECIES: uroporphyrinogen-III C-methyltransferase [Microbacterium]|uniref:uroporphyrinogen-III C-methyltransferase n=1 Tax=Microbacterium TaxID=33882 RepID=UPI0035ABA816